MLTLIDGPCAGTYMVKRAPYFLRAVSVKDAAGESDVLDQLDDTPKPYERVHVYQRQGGYSTVHLHMAKRSQSGFYVMANYKHLPDVDGEKLRDNTVWQEWALQNAPTNSSADDIVSIPIPIIAEETHEQQKEKET